ncbi:MAG TPA: tetratricopeptide repeat protein [Desulfurobacteriaceae bacterium]|nr:tetratricopeptide repeat protein [Desulfurobacteriaceae bacterium]
MKKNILVTVLSLVSISCGSNLFVNWFSEDERSKVLNKFAQGFIYMSYNQTKKGIEYLQEGNKYLKDPSIDLYIAKAYFKNNQIDKALKYALKAYNQHKDEKIAFFILMLYLNKKDFSNLTQFILKAYEDFPNNKVFLQILSNILDPNKIYKMAQALENKNPESALKFYNLAGHIFLEKENMKKAAQSFYKAALLNIYFLNYEKAIKLLEKAVSLDKNNSEYINALAYTYLLNEKPEKAKKYIKKLENLKEKNASILDTLAYYYYSIGNYKKALKLQKEAISKDSSNGILYAHLSMIYYKLGKPELAKRYAIIALDILKNYPHQILGEKKTLKYLHKIIKVKDHNPKLNILN